MGQDDAKNLILAAVLSMLVVLGWYLLFPPSAGARPESRRTARAASTASQETGAVPIPGAGGAVADPRRRRRRSRPRRSARTAPPRWREGQRIPIETPSVTGSIRLQGARLDDLHLSDYHVTVDPTSDTVILLNPAGGPDPYFADFGWVPVEGSNPGPLPDENTPWTPETGEGGAKLTPATPVTLVWDNGAGLVFRREISVDDQYMFTVRQTVENRTGAAVSLAPYGRITRIGGEASTKLWILHEGGVA